jgi:hypothetical protein
MKLVMCSVYDGAAMAFHPPFFMRTRGEARRSFAATCADVKSSFHTNPEDFALFYVGEFDDAVGSVIQPMAPERLVTASECVADL